MVTPIISESIREFLRMCVPYTCMMVLFLLNVISISIMITGTLEIPFILMALYYWSAYRPTLIPLWFVFILGLLFDLLSAFPLGLNALVFVATRWLVTDQRLFLTGQPFVILWLGFIIACTAATFTQWLLYGLMNLHWTPLQPLPVTILLAGALFPLVNIVLHATHRMLPEIRGQYSAMM